MRQAAVEFIVGIFIIIAVVCLAFLAIEVSGFENFSSKDTYTITASFANVGDLKVRAPVAISGVKVGQVASIELNPKTFSAVVTLAINKKYNTIPVDSSAAIYTAGLLGSNYINLSPGWSQKNLRQGSAIARTSPALILENLIGQLLFSLGGSKEKGSNKAATVAPSAVPTLNTSIKLGDGQH